MMRARKESLLSAWLPLPGNIGSLTSEVTVKPGTNCKDNYLCVKGEARTARYWELLENIIFCFLVP